MHNEEFQPWIPDAAIPHDLWVEAIHDDIEGLRFLLRGGDATKPTLRILFDSTIGYRNINESFRLETWESVPGFEKLPSLMIVKNSKWVREVAEEAGGVLKPEELTHYAIYTPEDCIDVISQSPPTVDWPNR